MIRFRRRPSAARFDQPWREVSYAVVDLETTGLDLRRDTIASYGAAVIEGGRMIAARNTYGLVHPDCALTPASIAIHTLRPCDLVDAPPLSEAVAVLDELLTGRILVAHAAWVEESFLARAFTQHGKSWGPFIIDTAAMARAAGLRAARGRAEPVLEALSIELGLPVVSPHHALGDAITTAQVFLALACRLSGRGYLTAQDFVELTVADRVMRR